MLTLPSYFQLHPSFAFECGLQNSARSIYVRPRLPYVVVGEGKFDTRKSGVHFPELSFTFRAFFFPVIVNSLLN